MRHWTDCSYYGTIPFERWLLVVDIRGIDKFVRVGGWDVVKCVYANILPQNTMYSNIIR